MVPWYLIAQNLLLPWLSWLVPTAAGFYLLRRYVRATERATGLRADLEGLREHVLRLEERLAAQDDDLERLADGQRFTTELLLHAGRRDAAAPAALGGARRANPPAATRGGGIPREGERPEAQRSPSRAT